MRNARTVKAARLKVGMEVHVELATRTKVFSRAPNPAHREFYETPANTLIDPLVVALPGALPVLNKRAVEMAIMVGLALNCQIAHLSKWDRKNYFYPDLPKGYQISQYDLPLCFDGELEFESQSNGKIKIGIIRAHLEEDTGKLGHELPGADVRGGGLPSETSLVDLNRAGAPLLEIVTEPEFTTAEDAVQFAVELRNICRFLRVTEGVMQRGHMRFEPNINVIIDTDDGREFATPIVEVKNLNSFKSLRGAIEHEFARQIEQWKVDGKIQAPGAKSTRGWDDLGNTTVLQREKEDAHDYRYFPEPDLPPVIVSEDWKQQIARQIPELPLQKRARYVSAYALAEVEAQALTSDPDLCEFYESCIEECLLIQGSELAKPHAGKECAKWLLNAGAKYANERGVDIAELGILPRQVAQIIDLREKDVIGSTSADELFGILCDPDVNDDALAVAQARGMIQVRDEVQLDAWIAQAIANQPQAANDFAGGKDAAIGRLVGEVMKLSAGKADAKAVQSTLRARLRG